MAKELDKAWLQERIFILRKQKVMLSTDLATLYGVEPRSLIQSVRRNLERFPVDFMFQLSDQEFANLKSQIVISSWGGLRAPPYAFTEQGIAMLSSVLRSKKAVQVNILIMREFVALRSLLQTNAELSHRLSELERTYDQKFRTVFEAIRSLIAPPIPDTKKQIGIHSDET